MLFLTHETELKTTDQMQALYFYNTRMPFHDKMVYVLAKIEEKYNNINYLAIDVNNFKGQCIRFSITSVPTVIVLKAGKEIVRVEGYVKRGQIIGAFDDICTF